MHNRTVVLKAIREYGPISRAELASITKLTPPAITNIVNEFLKYELIQEKGRRTSSSGRKSVLLSINSDRYFIIGVHAARNSLSAVMANLSGEILDKVVEDEKIFSDLKTMSEKVLRIIKKVMAKTAVEREKIIGIGIAAPGPVNAENGLVISRPPGTLDSLVSGREGAPFDWTEVPLRKIVEEELGMNVFADNCANASALAESWFGAGRGIDNLVLFSFGAGIGAGVIIDGMLYRGEDDVVAEIGHTTVDMKGPQCICGNYGCLELYSSNSVMEERAKKRVKDARRGLLYESVGGDPEKITAGVVFEAANRGDPIAQAVVEEEAQYLGVGVVNLVNIFSPEVVIIGTNELPDLNLDPLISSIREMIRKRAFSVVSKKVQIMPSLLKSSVQLIGAITLVLQDFFNSDRFKYVEETVRLRA